MADDGDREYFLRRVKEELESEGEDFRHILAQTRDAIYRIAKRIAARLRVAVERVLDALEEIANMFD